MPLSVKIKNILGIFFRVGLSAALLAYLFHKIDIPKTLDVVQRANFFYLYLAFGITFLIYILSLLRWFVIMKALDLKISFKNVSCYFGIGIFFNLFLPTSTGGDFIKTIGLFKYTDEKAKVVASVLLDRIFGLVAIIGVASGAFILGHKALNDSFLLFVIMMLGFFSGLGILFLFHEPAYSFACRLFNRIPEIKEKFLKLHYALALIKGQYKTFFVVMIVSLVMQGLLAVSFYLTAKGLHQDVALLSCLIFTPLICVAAALPSIGGLGVRDVSAVFLFAKVGVDAGTAASMSLLNFLFIVIIGLWGAMFYVAALSNRRVQCDLQDPVADKAHVG